MDELFETAKKIYDAMLQFGVEKVLIIPENLIKSVMEISLKRLGEFSETETQVFFEGSKILDKAGYRKAEK